MNKKGSFAAFLALFDFVTVLLVGVCSESRLSYLLMFLSCLWFVCMLWITTTSIGARLVTRGESM